MLFIIRGRGETAALHFSDVMWFGVLPRLKSLDNSTAYKSEEEKA